MRDVVGVDFDVVAVHRVGWEQAEHGVGGEPFFLDDLLQHGLRIGEQLARFLAHHFVLQNLRVTSGQFPCLEERCPVDEVDEDVERIVFQLLHAEQLGLGRCVLLPVGLHAMRARFFQRDVARLCPSCLRAVRAPPVVGLDLGHVAVAQGIAEQIAAHAHRARGVVDVHRGAARVVGFDLHRGMHARSGRAADQQRNLEALAFHLLRHMRHLFQRGRDEAGEADHVGVVFARGVEDLLARHHHAHVHHFEVVALQHHGDDVLADVVHVALHRGHHDLALGAGVAGAQFFRFDVGDQVRHGLLHHACRFHHLRQEHLARAEQVADHVHAGHQRAFDHFDRELGLQARFFGVLDDVGGDAAHQRMGQAFLHRAFAPFQIFDLFLAAALDGLGQLDQLLARVGVAIQHHVFHRVAQVFGNLFVHAELSGVDDAHAHAGLDGVVQEHGVDGFAHRLVAAEAERHVGYAAGNLGVGQILPDPAQSLR